MASAKGRVAQIKTFVLRELGKGPLKRSTLLQRALVAVPHAIKTTTDGAISQLHRDGKIKQIERGIWALTDGPIEESPSQEIAVDVTIKEDQFYTSFSDWLINEVGECTAAAALGGKVLGGKWGTPDVVGVYRVSDKGRYRRNEIVSFVSAEMKTDSIQTVTAFGQACSYLRFSHKVYLAIPQATPDDDKQRIESLCTIVGLGLVFFNATSKDAPDYEIRVRPIPREPDPTALNEILDRDEIYKKLR